MTPTTLTTPVGTQPEHDTRLHERILTREARIGVVGLGYVGLPLALEFARAGFSVTGLDSDEKKVDRVNTRRSYIEDVADGELEEVADTLRATANAAALADVDVVDICVPTPLRKTRDPDLSFVVQAVEAVARHLRPGQLIILESTTYTWRSRPSVSIRATPISARGRFPRSWAASTRRAPTWR
jgi:UDP-N-acetyl-D-glucosamine dehydrogenase